MFTSTVEVTHCYPCFFDRGYGCTDDLAVAQYAPGFDHTHVILTQMHAFTPYGKSNIYAVIDDKRDVVCFAFLMQFLCC